MAADVSSLVRVLNRYKDDRTAGSDSVGGKSTSLITQDLLGGRVGGGGFESVKNEYQELDLDLQVPTGWEKRLDLKSGKVYLQRCNSSSSASSSDHKQQTNQTVTKLQDLNFPPSPSKPLLNLFEETNLDLKLVSCSSSSPPPPQSSTNYQSVCTLDKVKFALERANKEPNYKKRSTTLWNNNNATSLSPSYSSSSSSIKDMKENEEIEEKVLSSPIAAGCPGCLCYVLIMKNNPKCPRCNSMVPMPAMKKPKIDLNMSI
ncbi:hypothetical protein EZV62_006209 [Acer yangbiense]|uniref:GIR1-like zinc ribbon domain-containing protein n=1 Tax=Acer yangbiense TaxID=1000413 RepID=A0A5C7IR32_9ROSI|nr:hypothetical protein EZV62_006209 [Acer yangbiense]